jgi:hypothetical protein
VILLTPDRAIYTMSNGLAPAFQRENLKVTLVAKAR